MQNRKEWPRYVKFNYRWLCFWRLMNVLYSYNITNSQLISRIKQHGINTCSYVKNSGKIHIGLYTCHLLGFKLMTADQKLFTWQNAVKRNRKNVSRPILVIQRDRNIEICAISSTLVTNTLDYTQVMIGFSSLNCAS